MRYNFTRQTLYVRSMGRLFRVLAMFDTDAEANAYMARHESAAVVSCIGPLILLADKYSPGETLKATEN